MTAMKKTNAKIKSPTPATTTTKTTKKKSSTEPGQTDVAPVAIPTTAPGAAAVATIKAVPDMATIKPLVLPPTVRAVAPAQVQTKIVARADVGFGNALYVRGDGAGLSWNQGKAMECVANDQWELVLGESSRPVSFKLLLNDTTWCTGPDSVVASGSTTTVTPDFA